MRIGEAADHLGVNVQTLRFYEREGLLPQLPRSAAGYRRFDSASIRRIEFIRHAQVVGFTLNEISELLSLRADPDGSCDEVQRYAEKKIEELDSRLVKLKSMKQILQNLAERCESGLPATCCPVLEALADDQPMNQRDRRDEE